MPDDRLSTTLNQCLRYAEERRDDRMRRELSELIKSGLNEKIVNYIINDGACVTEKEDRGNLTILIESILRKEILEAAMHFIEGMDYRRYSISKLPDLHAKLDAEKSSPNDAGRDKRIQNAEDELSWARTCIQNSDFDIHPPKHRFD